MNLEVVDVCRSRPRRRSQRRNRTGRCSTPCIRRECSIVGFAGRFEMREAREQFLEEHAGFHARERGAQAEVFAEAEGEVTLPGVVAADVEAVGVVAPDFLVAVRGGVEQQQHVAAADATCRAAPCRRRRRAMKLCTGVHQRSISSIAFGSRQGSASSRSRCSGLRASSSEPPEIRLRVVSLPAASSVMQNIRICGSSSCSPSISAARERRDQIVLRRAAPLGEHAGEVAEHLAERRVGRGRAPAAARFDHRVGPALEARAVAARHAEHLGDHVHRQRHRERFDQIA